MLGTTLFAHHRHSRTARCAYRLQSEGPAITTAVGSSRHGRFETFAGHARRRWRLRFLEARRRVVALREYSRGARAGARQTKEVRGTERDVRPFAEVSARDRVAHSFHLQH